MENIHKKILPYMEITALCSSALYIPSRPGFVLFLTFVNICI